MKREEKIERLKAFTTELFPNPTVELDYENEFQLLVAILMSAQVTDKQVNKVNKTFHTVLICPDDAIDMGIAKIESYINTISFYKNKSRFIYETSIILKEQHNSQVPKTLEELTKLPGVGIKTAKVFLGIVINAPYLGVDTHVHRVLNRTGIVNTKDALQTDRQVEKVFKIDDLATLHHTLILFGRYYCIARKPKCEKCEFKDFCKYYAKQKNERT